MYQIAGRSVLLSGLLLLGHLFDFLLLSLFRIGIFLLDGLLLGLLKLAMTAYVFSGNSLSAAHPDSTFREYIAYHCHQRRS